MNNKQDELITINELCKLLKVKESHIRALIFKREIEVIKVGRLIRFSMCSIEKWLTGQSSHASRSK